MDWTQKFSALCIILSVTNYETLKIIYLDLEWMEVNIGLRKVKGNIGMTTCQSKLGMRIGLVIWVRYFD